MDHLSTLEVLLFETLSVVLLVSGMLFYLVFTSHRRAKTLQQQEQNLRKQLTAIPDFLKRELRSTKETLESRDRSPSDNAQPPSVMRLRCHWLTAERRALANNGQSDSELTRIEDEMKPVLKQLAARFDTGASEKAGDAVAADDTGDDLLAALTEVERGSLKEREQRISEMLAVVSDQQQTIAQLKQQLRSYRLRSEQENPAAQALEAMLDQSEANSDAIVRRGARIEPQLTVTRESLERLQSDLDKVDELATGHGSSAPATGAADVAASLSDAVASYESTRNELRNLHHENSRQRQLIGYMDQQLAGLRKDEKVYEISWPLIEKMKLQLRDSEACTAVLESYVQDLESRINALTEQIDDSSASPGSAELDQLQSIAAYRHVIQFVKEVAECTSREDLAAAVIEFLGQDAVFEARFIGSFDTYRFSFGNTQEAHGSQYLDSTSTPRNGPWAHQEEGTLLAWNNTRYFFERSFWEASRSRAEYFESGLRVVDSAVARMDMRQVAERQRQMLRQVLDRTREGLQEVEVQRQYLVEELDKATRQLVNELHEFSRDAQLSSTQREVFEEMLREYGQRLKSIFESGDTLTRLSGKLIKAIERAGAAPA